MGYFYRRLLGFCWCCCWLLELNVFVSCNWSIDNKDVTVQSLKRYGIIFSFFNFLWIFERQLEKLDKTCDWTIYIEDDFPFNVSFKQGSNNRNNDHLRRFQSQKRIPQIFKYDSSSWPSQPALDSNSFWGPFKIKHDLHISFLKQYNVATSFYLFVN